MGAAGRGGDDPSVLSLQKAEANAHPQLSALVCGERCQWREQSRWLPTPGTAALLPGRRSRAHLVDKGARAAAGPAELRFFLELLQRPEEYRWGTSSFTGVDM